jgi:hypothetical protein
VAAAADGTDVAVGSGGRASADGCSDGIPGFGTGPPHPPITPARPVPAARASIRLRLKAEGDSPWLIGGSHISPAYETISTGIRRRHDVTPAAAS